MEKPSFVLKDGHIEICEKKAEEEKDKLTDWLRENKVPDYVDYVIGDQYLRLDLRKKEYRELLYYDSLNENTIILREDFVSKNTGWLKDEKDKKHGCEMVFSFNRKSDRDSEKFKIEKYASEKPYYFSTNHRTLFPGEDGWYYYKLYGMKGREDEFIGIDLKEIVYKIHLILCKYYEKRNRSRRNGRGRRIQIL